MTGLMNSYKNLNIFFNVDDIIKTSSTKVLTELKTLHILMHFYLNLAQMSAEFGAGYGLPPKLQRHS